MLRIRSKGGGAAGPATCTFFHQLLIATEFLASASQVSCNWQQAGRNVPHLAAQERTIQAPRCCESTNSRLKRARLHGGARHHKRPRVALQPAISTKLHCVRCRQSSNVLKEHFFFISRRWYGDPAARPDELPAVHPTSAPLSGVQPWLPEHCFWA